jgi:type IV secretion system protein VirB5
MKKICISLLSLLLGSSLFNSTYAAAGADDALIIAKLTSQLKQLEKQYKLLNKTYNNAESQMKSVDKLTKMNSGHSGFGRLHNSTADVRKRQSADTWRESLKGVSGGNPERYKELVKAYEKQHESLNRTQFSRGASTRRSARFDQEQQLTKAASVESEAAFNDINESLKRIHDLSDQIEKAENTKAAVDLNSRLVAEVAYLQAQNLKAQAILNQQLAMKAGSSLEDDAELSKYLTN